MPSAPSCSAHGVQPVRAARQIDEKSPQPDGPCIPVTRASITKPGDVVPPLQIATIEVHVRPHSPSPDHRGRTARSASASRRRVTSPMRAGPLPTERPTPFFLTVSTCSRAARSTSRDRSHRPRRRRHSTICMPAAPRREVVSVPWKRLAARSRRRPSSFFRRDGLARHCSAGFSSTPACQTSPNPISTRKLTTGCRRLAAQSAARGDAARGARHGKRPDGRAWRAR